MPEAANPEAFNNLDYRKLYMKYLGTLRVLGTLATLADDATREAMAEELDGVFSDASTYLAGHVRMIRRHDGWRMEPL
jgi:hypothetical protein